MLGDDEIFSSSVRALLHLSLQKRCHCQPDDARARTSTNQLRRRYASTDPAIPWPPDATSLSWFRHTDSVRLPAPGEHNSHEEQGNRWNSIQLLFSALTALRLRSRMAQPAGAGS